MGKKSHCRESKKKKKKKKKSKKKKKKEAAMSKFSFFLCLALLCFFLSQGDAKHLLIKTEDGDTESPDPAGSSRKAHTRRGHALDIRQLRRQHPCSQRKIAQRN